MIKPGFISLYVDNEDKEHHSLLRSAQLKVLLTVHDKQAPNSKLVTPSTADKDNSKIQNLPKASPIKSIAKLSTDKQSPNFEHATLSTKFNALHPKATSLITNEAKVLVSFLPGTSVDMKNIVKAEILVEQTLCDHIKVKERQPFNMFCFFTYVLFTFVYVRK